MTVAGVECPCGEEARRFFQRKSPEDVERPRAYCNRCSVDDKVQSAKFARHWLRMTREEFMLYEVLTK